MHYFEHVLSYDASLRDLHILYCVILSSNATPIRPPDTFYTQEAYIQSLKKNLVLNVKKILPLLFYILNNNDIKN